MDDTMRCGTKPDRSPPSGRFVLRIDPGLHAALRAAARQAELSLNDYCARKLASPGTTPGPATEAVSRAATQFGEALAGVVVFGSWARDELADASDVDLLVILDSGLPITRDLYRAWDAGPPQRWDSRPVEPHFIHLPSSGARISGLWAEAALDGVVLFERDLAVSRRLVAIRREIVAGRLVRRLAHGRPYWVEAA